MKFYLVFFDFQSPPQPSLNISPLASPSKWYYLFIYITILYISYYLTLLLSAATRQVLLVSVLLSKESKEWIKPEINSVLCTLPIALTCSVCINHFQ